MQLLPAALLPPTPILKMRTGVDATIKIKNVVEKMKKTFYRDSQTDLRRTLRRNATLTERMLWHHLRKKQLEGFKFRRQAGIGRYIADFYCPKARLIIELDGNSHTTEEAKRYDVIRDAYIENLGLTVLRFTNNAVLYQLKYVLEQISKHLASKKPSSS